MRFVSPLSRTVRHAFWRVSSLNLGRSVETPGGFLLRRSGDGLRLVRNRIDDRAQQACRGLEADAGLVATAVEVQASVNLDLDRVDI